jgi:hypothetical protein
MIGGNSCYIIRPIAIGGIPEETLELIGITFDSPIGFTLYLAG